MGQVIQKICRVCGQDVANQKRTKDSAGNYYCQPCYDEAVERQNQPHVSPATDSTSKCSSCGARVEEDAAFCARCGAKQDGNLSPDEEVDAASIVVYLRRYGELAHALKQAANAEREYQSVRPRMIAAGATSDLARIDALHAKGQALKADYIAECDELKQKLQAYDSARVVYIRDLFLQNEKVDATLKDGLQRDPLNVFAVQVPSRSDERVATVEAEQDPFLRNAASEAKVPPRRRRRPGPNPKFFSLGFVGALGGIVLAAKGSQWDFGLLVVLGGLVGSAGSITMLAWFVILLLRKVQPAQPAHEPQSAGRFEQDPTSVARKTLSRQSAGRWGWAAGLGTFIAVCTLVASTGLMMRYEIVFVVGVFIAIAAGCMVGALVSDRLSGGYPSVELIFGKKKGETTTALFGVSSLAVLAAIVGTWWWFLTADPNKTGLMPLVACVATTIGGIFAFAVLATEVKKVCPRCGRLHAAEIVNASMLDRHLETSDVLRTDHHYDNWGKPIAKTQRTEQVITQVSSYAVSRRCKFCHHTWGDIETIRT